MGRQTKNKCEQTKSINWLELYFGQNVMKVFFKEEILKQSKRKGASQMKEKSVSGRGKSMW